MNRSYKLTGTQTELTEPFTYDNYNRLISYGLNGGESVSYSDNGNITAKGDAGVYEYDPAMLNAVLSITNNLGTIDTAEQAIEYTAFNMTSSVEEGTKRLELTYGPGNQRIKSVLKSNNAVVKTKYYSGLYEKEVTASTRELNYISCPSGIFAVIVKQGSTESLYYTETDHLGSTIGLINSTDGSFTERSSFDAWGRRRNPANWSYNNVPQNSILERGFTGHEQVDLFGLINMNGRMYDPVLGRFAGVDPFIQSPESSQSYNGYSYCVNNPLIYTDPSGMRMIVPDDYGAGSSTYSHRMTGIRFPDLGDWDSDWLNSYLYYLHACFQNGYMPSVSQFNNALNTSTSNGTVYIQTGIMDYYTFTSFDGRKTWQQGNYINSKPIYSEIRGDRLSEHKNSVGYIFGSSIDGTISAGGGYGIEGGFYITSNGKQGNQFVSRGVAVGNELSAGWNFIFIKTKSNFSFNDLKGMGVSAAYNFGLISISIIGNSAPTYPENSMFESYYGIKIGIGLGFGGSYSPNTNTTFLNWIPDFSKSFFHWK